MTTHVIKMSALSFSISQDFYHFTLNAEFKRVKKSFQKIKIKKIYELFFA